MQGSEGITSREGGRERERYWKKAYVTIIMTVLCNVVIAIVCGNAIIVSPYVEDTVCIISSLSREYQICDLTISFISPLAKRIVCCLASLSLISVEFSWWIQNERLCSLRLRFINVFKGLVGLLQKRDTSSLSCLPWHTHTHINTHTHTTRPWETMFHVRASTANRWWECL